MKKTTFLIASSLVLLSSMVEAKSDSVRPGAVLFKVKADATPAELKKLNALFQSRGLIKEHKIKNLRISLAEFGDKEAGRELVLSKLIKATGAVEFAEPDALIEPTLTPNDSGFSSQWHHQTIHSPLAWDSITAPENVESARVCVLDTGVDTDHPDLVDNLVLPGYNARLQVAGNVEDAHGHGTGTAGVIGAVGNNGIGVSGVAWDIDIIPVQINISDDDSRAYISDMATGIRWCADQGAKVANLSYGGAQYQTIADAAQYLRDKGGLLFMSAGNAGTYHDTTEFPDYSSFVVVGSTDKNDEKSSFSEYGPYVDLAAPGESILTTYLDARYVNYSGTSFSSPMTAGVGALIYAVNPNFTPDEVENILFNSATDLGNTGEDDLYGHGRVDAGAAVQAALDSGDTPNQPPVANATATPVSGIVPLEVNFDGSNSYDEGEIVSYVWNFGDGSSASGMSATHLYTQEGIYSATLTVKDDQGAETTSNAITIQVEPNNTIFNAPSNLTAAVEGANVNLTWEDNANSETGFVIERAVKVRRKYRYSVLATVPSDTVSYIDTVTQTGDYLYRVKAINETTSTDYSNEVSVTVDTLDEGTDPQPSIFWKHWF